MTVTPRTTLVNLGGFMFYQPLVKHSVVYASRSECIYGSFLLNLRVKLLLRKKRSVGLVKLPGHLVEKRCVRVSEVCHIILLIYLCVPLLSICSHVSVS